MVWDNFLEIGVGGCCCSRTTAGNVLEVGATSAPTFPPEGMLALLRRSGVLSALPCSRHQSLYRRHWLIDILEIDPVLLHCSIVSRSDSCSCCCVLAGIFGDNQNFDAVADPLKINPCCPGRNSRDQTSLVARTDLISRSTVDAPIDFISRSIVIAQADRLDISCCCTGRIFLDKSTVVPLADYFKGSLQLHWPILS